MMIEFRAGKTPAQALLAAARELIRHAQSLAEVERHLRRIEAHDPGGCAPPVLTGGPRFTRTT